MQFWDVHQNGIHKLIFAQCGVPGLGLKILVKSAIHQATKNENPQ